MKFLFFLSPVFRRLRSACATSSVHWSHRSFPGSIQSIREAIRSCMPTLNRGNTRRRGSPPLNTLLQQRAASNPLQPWHRAISARTERSVTHRGRPSKDFLDASIPHHTSTWLCQPRAIPRSSSLRTGPLAAREPSIASLSHQQTPSASGETTSGYWGDSGGDAQLYSDDVRSPCQTPLWGYACLPHVFVEELNIEDVAAGVVSLLSRCGSQYDALQGDKDIV